MKMLIHLRLVILMEKKHVKIMDIDKVNVKLLVMEAVVSIMMAVVCL